MLSQAGKLTCDSGQAMLTHAVHVFSELVVQEGENVAQALLLLLIELHFSATLLGMDTSRTLPPDKQTAVDHTKLRSRISNTRSFAFEA